MSTAYRHGSDSSMGLTENRRGPQVAMQAESLMPERRFPPPWTVEEYNDAFHRAGR
jgi:hypothetical protein